MKENKNLSDIRVGFLQIPLTRIILLIMSDIFSVFLAEMLSLYVRYDLHFMDVPQTFWWAAIEIYLPNVVFMLLIFHIFRLYNSVWRYASDTEMVNNGIAVIFCAVAAPVFCLITGVQLPVSFPFYYGLFLLIFTCGVRFGYRFLRVLQKRRLDYSHRKIMQNCMVIGGGAAGNSIIKEIEASNYLNLKVVCVIDDNPGCHGKYLRGIPIVGARDTILDNVQKYAVDEIIIAIPSASRQKIKPIVEICKESGCHLRILPGMYQLINGDVNVSNLREVQIEDLLGRDPIEVNVDEILGYVQGKTILVTGGGGSIGSELCRQIAGHSPKRLIIFDIYSCYI